MSADTYYRRGLRNSIIPVQTERSHCFGEERCSRMMRSLANELRRADAVTISSRSGGRINSRTLGFLPYSIASSSLQRWANRTEFARMILCLALLQLVIRGPTCSHSGQRLATAKEDFRKG